MSAAPAARRRLVGTRLGERGQGITELAVVLPTLLLVVLAGFDFGRALQSWVSLQNMARIGANFAAVNPYAWGSPGVNVVRQRYQDLTKTDLTGLGCTMPGNVAAPDFPSGTDVGDPAVVIVTCNFKMLTPLVGALLGNQITLAARSTFPIRSGTAGGAPVSSGSTPGASFTASPVTGTAPLTVTFTDTSKGRPSAWCWNFGDGAAQPTCEASTKNATHTYACASGTCHYTAGLRTTSVNGVSGWATVAITVNAPPPAVASFTTTPTPASGPPPFTVQLNDTSTGGATSWCWNFGDGAVWPSCDTTLRNPSHTFSSVGTYNVRLCAYGPGGPASPCASPATASVNVSYAVPAPVANFTFFPNGGTAPITINFTDTSTHSPTSWLWNFGAGQGTSTLQNPSKNYTTAGVYTVTLTATNIAGSGSISKNVTITSPMCTVPNFIGMSVRTSTNITTINNTWIGAGFTGSLGWTVGQTAVPTGTNKSVNAQSLAATTLQPCSSSITLGHN